MLRSLVALQERGNNPCWCLHVQRRSTTHRSDSWLTVVLGACRLSADATGGVILRLQRGTHVLLLLLLLHICLLLSWRHGLVGRLHEGWCDCRLREGFWVGGMWSEGRRLWPGRGDRWELRLRGGHERCRWGYCRCWEGCRLRQGRDRGHVGWEEDQSHRRILLSLHVVFLHLV